MAPWCRLALNSPLGAFRSMAATTLSPITKQRRSLPSLSLMNSWTRMLAFRLVKALITLSAALLVSARTTPMPLVLSRSLMTRGAPPTILMSSLVSRVELAKPVTGMSTPLRERSWRARSLSRDLRMERESLRG